MNRRDKMDEDYQNQPLESQQPSQDYYKGQREERVPQNSQVAERKDTRGWSKSRFAGYLVLATVLAIVVSFLLVSLFYGNVTYSTYEWGGMNYSPVPGLFLFLGFFFIMLHVGYSIVGVRYSKAKYGKNLWNAKTWIPSAELVILIAVLVFYIILINNNSVEVLSVSFLLLLLFNLGGLSLLIAYGIGWWREREAMLEEIRKWEDDCIDLEELAYLFGIKKSSAKKQVDRLFDRLLSDDELRGYLDEENDYLIKSGAKDEIINYLREHGSEREIPLQDLSNHFQIPEDVVIKFIRELMQERDIGGEIDQLKGIYQVEEGYSETEPTPTPEEETPSVPEPAPEPSKPQSESQPEEIEPKSYAEIKEEIDQLQDEEDMIDVRAIESALEQGDIEKADELLEELQDKYREYKDTINELNQLDDRKASLTNKLADGEIDRDTFNEAVESIKHQKHDLEEKLNKLRQEVIHEDYEKPF